MAEGEMRQKMTEEGCVFYTRDTHIPERIPVFDFPTPLHCFGHFIAVSPSSPFKALRSRSERTIY